MSIHFDEADMSFHLRAGSSSYILQVVRGRCLAHRYWGPLLGNGRLAQPLVMIPRAFSPSPFPDDPLFSPDTVPQEYPAFGAGDFRAPAFEVQSTDGSTVVDLRYQGHRILDGKPSLPGLPATYVETDDEAQTLEIDMADPLNGLALTLRYTAFARRNVIARSVLFVNRGSAPLRVLRALSAAVDFPDAGFEMTRLSGAWSRERTPYRAPLLPGGQFIESRRGASSHQQNPFVAFSRPGTSEEHGDVYGMSLVYSGNFLAGAEVDQFATARALAGINPFDFTWLLMPGESFQTPEAVLVYSGEGFGGMSRTYHRLYRERLARGQYRDTERPILLNNWEATYFRFDAGTLTELAHSAADLGVELFVLDDGWFGRRDNDHSSLGDWTVDERKLPDGLNDLAARIESDGLRFGLWFEPEMVSPDSDLYRAHPDWCLHVAGRSRSEGRNQLVLDLSREDVCAYIVDAVSKVLKSAPIRYVKWDMNRHMTEVGSALLPPERQRETAHRYMLGLYRVLETVTAAFPDVLFESCSGGGGRFDPGFLYYMPQCWTSDNTDAIARLEIQFGTSLVYPAVSMGAHVSAVPNHQVGRDTRLFTRGLVAMMGSFGYELDVRRLSQEDRDEIRRQIAFYREIRPLAQFGDQYRLRWPEGDGGGAAWMYVAQDKREAVVTFVQNLALANAPVRFLRLAGLDPHVNYHVSLFTEAGQGRGIEPPPGMAACTAGGDELMAAGLVVPYLHGDFRACCWRLQSV